MDRGGRIWLTIERQGAFVEVRVKDAGVGIPSEKLPRLFELFFQVDKTLERSQGGLGVGLSLVRRLMELHGGSVEARSDVWVAEVSSSCACLCSSRKLTPRLRANQEVTRKPRVPAGASSSSTTIGIPPIAVQLLAAVAR